MQCKESERLTSALPLEEDAIADIQQSCVYSAAGEITTERKGSDRAAAEEKKNSGEEEGPSLFFFLHSLSLFFCSEEVSFLITMCKI
jgi:hypothetical protein